MRSDADWPRAESTPGEGTPLVRTYLVSSHQARRESEFKRRLLIRQALSLESGDQEHPREHLVRMLGNGLRASFLKPGKEADYGRANRRLHDMTPVVGDTGFHPRLDQLWTHTFEAAQHDADACKRLLTLVYRLGYLLDHTVDGDRVVYGPTAAIADEMASLERRIGPTFGIWGVEGFLAYLDLLGWNEDVKYHSEGNAETFGAQHAATMGRVKTLLTCVRIPWEIHLFAEEVKVAQAERRPMDHASVQALVQRFAKTRTTGPPTEERLVSWLAPYLLR